MSLSVKIGSDIGFLLLAKGGRQVVMLNATGSTLADQVLNLRTHDARRVAAYAHTHAKASTPTVASLERLNRLGRSMRCSACLRLAAEDLDGGP